MVQMKAKATAGFESLGAVMASILERNLGHDKLWQDKRQQHVGFEIFNLVHA